MGTSFNRFDALRLALATLVFLYHGVALSGLMPFSSLELTLSAIAELSIQGFFIISGALVYSSWQRSDGLSDYVGKRVRRLYPAYVVIILVPALISGILSFGQAGALQDVLRYLAANLVFLNFMEGELPGLFSSNRYSEVNGALWTLKIEVMFYIALPVLAWGLSKLKQYWWIGLGLVVIGAFAWYNTMLALDHPYNKHLARQLPGQMMYFAAGMAMWRLWDVASNHSALFFAIGVAALTAALLVPPLDALRVLGLFGIVAGIAFMPGPELNAARWGDVSYGVYIVHFPIVQGLVAAGLFAALGLICGLVIAAALVFAVSYLLWWWVEKPALRRDSHYRKLSEERATECGNTKPSPWMPPEKASQS